MFSHAKFYQTLGFTKAKERRAANRMDGRTPESQDTKGQAAAHKKMISPKWGQSIQRRSIRRARRLAKMELASMALA